MLATCYSRTSAPPAGFEPATRCLEGSRSNPLSYGGRSAGYEPPLIYILLDLTALGRQEHWEKPKDRAERTLGVPRPRELTVHLRRSSYLHLADCCRMASHRSPRPLTRRQALTAAGVAGAPRTREAVTGGET